MARHYLDHASTSPLRPAARAAMIEALDLDAADPGRIHAEALTIRAAIEDCRDRVASFLGARPREVVFTSGATESITAACWGAAERGTAMVVPTVEHSAVRMAADRHGSIEVGCDPTGRVDLDALDAAIADDTSLVHLQWANHEVGTLQPVREAAELCRSRGVLLHVDAAQAVGRVPIDFAGSSVDLLSVSAHKLGGPPGTGALLVRRGVRLRPLLAGGDQERARRAGLENLPALAGFAAACDELADGGVEREASVAHRHTEAIAHAALAVRGVRRHGDSDRRVPHLVCLGIDDVEPQAVLLGLDRAGIAAHSGSACASEALEPSPVLQAMGVDAHRSLRVSVGWSTTDDDVAAFASAFPRVLDALRSLA